MPSWIYIDTFSVPSNEQVEFLKYFESETKEEGKKESKNGKDNGLSDEPNTQDDLSEENKSSIKKNALQKYILLGFMSHFCNQDANMEQGLIGQAMKAGNYKYLDGIFNLDFLFLAYYGRDEICKKLNLNEKDERIKGILHNVVEMLGKTYLIPINVELIEESYQVCRLNTDIKEKTKNEVEKYYKIFLKNINSIKSYQWNCLQEKLETLEIIDSSIDYFTKMYLLLSKASEVGNTQNDDKNNTKNSNKANRKIDKVRVGHISRYYAGLNLLQRIKSAIDKLPNSVGLEVELLNYVTQLANKTGDMPKELADSLLDFGEKVNDRIEEYNTSLDKEE